MTQLCGVNWQKTRINNHYGRTARTNRKHEFTTIMTELCGLTENTNYSQPLSLWQTCLDWQKTRLYYYYDRTEWTERSHNHYDRTVWTWQKTRIHYHYDRTVWIYSDRKHEFTSIMTELCGLNEFTTNMTKLCGLNDSLPLWQNCVDWTNSLPLWQNCVDWQNTQIHYHHDRHVWSERIYNHHDRTVDWTNLQPGLTEYTNSLPLWQSCLYWKLDFHNSGVHCTWFRLYGTKFERWERGVSDYSGIVWKVRSGGNGGKIRKAR